MSKDSIKALVTGGAGFIGSQIAEGLCRKGANVVVLDNLSEGKLSNLDWRRPGDSLEFVQGDIGDSGLIARLVQGCDWVFHEAAIASVPRSVAEPLQSNADNVESSLKLLVAARDAGVRRFMFASSSAIYGNNPAPAKTEDLPPDTLSPYALQKYASERYGQLFHELYGLQTVSLRYFNVFGPRQSFNSAYSGVIARFCTTMLAGRAPTIFGDGKQSRDFVFVHNVVQANLKAAEGNATRVAGKVFNVGGGQSIDLLQLVEEINRLTGQNLKPGFEPARAGDVRASMANISQAREYLGYNPDVTWQEGLKQTLDFYRNGGA